jgi:hypothetical protein
MTTPEQSETIDSMTNQEIIDNFNLNELNRDDDSVSFNAQHDDDKCSVTSLDSNNKRKRMKHDTKDPHYHKYNINKKGMTIKIESYSTRSMPGSFIRCPYTGIRSNDRVGSSDEDFYFKVSMPAISKGNEAVVYFYNSPEDFERHHLVSLSQEIKKKFHDRKMAIKIE